MPSKKETLELLSWQGQFGHASHLLSLSGRAGSQAAFSAGRDSFLSLQSKLLEAIVGGHIKAARESGIKILPHEFGGDVQKRQELYCFFEKVLSASGDTLSVLQEAAALLQKMIGQKEMGREDREKGIALFSAIESAFGRALGNEAEGGRQSSEAG